MVRDHLVVVIDITCSLNVKKLGSGAFLNCIDHGLTRVFHPCVVEVIALLLFSQLTRIDTSSDLCTKRLAELCNHSRNASFHGKRKIMFPFFEEKDDP